MTMRYIATATATTTTSSFNFDNIPTEFKHLHFKIFGRGTTTFSGGLSTYITPFGLNVSASRRHIMTASGAATASSSDAGQGVSALIADAGATSNVFANVVVDILDWNNTNKNLVLKGFGGYDSNGYGVVSLSSGLLVRGTGTLTGFYLQTDGNWVTGSRVDLYGLTSNDKDGL